MSGAGSASLAWAPETNYLSGVGDSPTYRDFGASETVDASELSRNLLEIYAPDDPETQSFLAQNLGGQLDVSFLMRDDDYHRLIFSDGFTGFASGLAPSAEVYAGVDTAQGTTERQFRGWSPATASISYNGPTETVRVTLSGAYGTEERNQSLTPGVIDAGGDEVPGHGAALSLAGTPVSKLQSATLSFEGLSRLQRGPQQTPVDAVVGNVSTSVEMQSLYEDPRLYERVLGSAGASTIEKTVDEVAASLEFAVEGSTVASYDFQAAPDTYDWQDLVNPDNDLTESITWRGRAVTGSDPT
ncbi:hypothetical protein WHO98_12185 (plasmid) [Halobacterium salinarum]|uniref:hypothetical protein n=2 Tax=Halobacterium salinarum TaxID=2242 RepID=UPI0030D623AB